MNQLFANLKGLGRGRLAIMGAVGLGVVLATLFGLSTLWAPSYQALYTGLSPSSASRIVGALEQAGFQTQVSADSAVVSVQDSDLARARMVVAAAGLAQEGAPGWEIFDGSTGIGMNSFMQRVTRLRALEGELARSIQTLDGVDAARVHLVLPEREAFSRDTPDPSASIVVRSRMGGQVSRREAIAIRNLVAAAVPSLDPSFVTVLSATGETILAEDSGTAAEAVLGSAKANLDASLARSIESILSARVGAGNVRVQVSHDLSNERRVMVEESFDPDQQVARSTETTEETSEGSEAMPDQVGVQGNIPAGLGGEDAGRGSRQSNQLTRERTEYEIGSRRSETVVEPGDIERVTVAVLVNGIFAETEDGGFAYEERDPAEIARLEELVRAAMGFDEDRGDQVSIDSLRFMDYSMALSEEPGNPISQTIAENIPFILRLVFAMIVVALILVFLVRPLINRAFPPNYVGVDEDHRIAAEEPEAEAAAIAGAGAPASIGSTAVATQASRPSTETEVAAYEGDPLDSVDFDDGLKKADFMAITSVHGLVTRKSIEAARRQTDEDNEAALAVLRGWLGQGA